MKKKDYQISQSKNELLLKELENIRLKYESLMSKNNILESKEQSIFT
jgi:hypothetical protein